MTRTTSSADAATPGDAAAPADTVINGDVATQADAAVPARLAECRAEITVDAAVEHLPRLLEAVDRVCRESGAEASFAYDVRLAVDEVCSNLIAHGYRGLAPGPIALSLESRPDRMVVSIADRGHRFDLRTAPHPDLHASVETRRAGGLGCHLVRSVMNDIDYRSDPDGANRLTLVRRVATA